MRVSCIIPAYNEAATIADVVRAARDCAVVDDVIVVSDGSTDSTARYAAQARADQVIVLYRNGGKGRAVLEAAAQARGDVLLLLDADLVGVTPAHLAELLAPVLDGRAEMAVALFADDPWHSLMRPLSGQRALRRSLLLARPEELKWTGFGLELALDRMARERRATVARVVWRGIGHRSKQEKYGTVNGLRLKARASSDLMRQARRVVRPRPAAVPRRAPSMLVAIMVLVALLAFLVPVFLVHPSSASAHSLPAFSMPSAGDRILVVVAHPDDEVIGAGGLIATARRLGASVSVVVVTNGDSNRLSAAFLTRKVRPGANQLIEEGRVRQRETLEALSRLGVPASQVFFLGFPDRLLDRVMRAATPVVSPYTRLGSAVYPDVVRSGAPYTRQALVELLAQIVARVRPTLIVTHGPFDSHTDHRAVGALVDGVRGNVPVVAFLIHAPSFPRPLRSSRRDPLTPPGGLVVDPAWKWVRFDLSPDAEQAKQQAINAYRSQIVTPYLRLLLASFVRTNELFAVREP